MRQLFGAIGLLVLVVQANRALSADIVSDQGFKVFSYDLTLNIDDTNAKFTGNLTMLVYYGGTGTKSLVLNSMGLKTNKNLVKVQTIYPKTVVSVVTNDDEQTMTIVLDTQFTKEMNYTIIIPYTGIFNNTKQGLFKSSNGNIIITNFFPTYARMVFPCFDFPSMKAKFTVTLMHSPSWSAYFFQPNGSKLDFGKSTFGPTPMISTYSLGFALTRNYKSPFTLSNDERITFVLSKDIDIMINPYVTPYLKMTPFKDMFESSGLSTLLLISVDDLPVDYINAYGILFIKSSFLKLNKNISYKDKFHLALNLLNAIAKQFYGTQVTPVWWNDILIYESVPIVLQYKAFRKLNVLSPELIQEMELELQDKALTANRPVLIPKSNVTSHEQISDAMTNPAVWKGAAILNMMGSTAGSQSSDLETALTAFFKQNVFSSVNSTQLMMGILGKNDTTDWIMWLTNPSYPLVYASSSSDIISISEDIMNENLNWVAQKWNIPVTYWINNETNYIWLNENFNQTVQLRQVNSSDIVVINSNSGVYRVEYDDTMSATIWKNQPELPVNVRTQLISDSMSLALSGREKLILALNSTNYMINEKEYMPWVAAFKGFDILRNMYFNDTLLRAAMENKVRSLIEAIAGELGWDLANVNNYMQNIERGFILGKQCQYGDIDCQQTAMDLYMKFQKDPTNEVKYGYDLVPVIECQNQQTVHDANRWETYFDKMYSPVDPLYIRERVLKILACSSNIDRYLKKVVGQHFIPKEDTQRAMAAMYTRPEHVTRVMKFLNNRFGELIKILDPDTIAGFLTGIGPMLSTKEQHSYLMEIQNLTASNTVLKKAWNQAHNSMMFTMNLKKKFADDVMNWCNSTGSLTSTVNPTVSTSSITPSPTQSTAHSSSSSPSPTPSTTKKPGAASSTQASLLLIGVATLLAWTSFL